MIQNPIEFAETLEPIYGELTNAVVNAFEAQETLTQWERKIASERYRILTAHDPKELGSNEAARNAKIEELMTEFREGHREAEDQSRLAKHFLELARIDVECGRAQLRCLEIAGPALLALPPAIASDTPQEVSKRRGRKSKGSDTPASETPPPESPAGPQPIDPQPIASTDVLARVSLAQPDLSKFTVDELKQAIKAIPLPPQMTRAEHDLYWLIHDQIVHYEPSFRDPMGDDIRAAFKPVNPLAGLADGEVVERMNKLPNSRKKRTPDQEAEYRELASDMRRRMPNWFDPYDTDPAEVIPVPHFVLSPEPAETAPFDDGIDF